VSVSARVSVSVSVSVSVGVSVSVCVSGTPPPAHRLLPTASCPPPSLSPFLPCPSADELFLTSAMELHPYTALLGKPAGYYLGWAVKEWTWLQNSGMMNPSTGLLNDGLRCAVNCSRAVLQAPPRAVTLPAGCNYCPGRSR
jgi:hypothetical protein